MALTKKNQAGINNVEVTYPINDFSQLKIAGNYALRRLKMLFQRPYISKSPTGACPRTCLEACTFGARD